jgi:protein Tex
MIAKYVELISGELNIGSRGTEAVIALLADGATVPFISRYRKEATGSLDEVQVTGIRDRLEQLVEMDKRRETILKTIDEQGKLTPELKANIEAAMTMTALEDIYLPYKPKRRTRATIAKEKGLEPLAKMIFGQGDFNVHLEAGKYINAEKEVADTDEALAGARDIIAEWISEDAPAREKIRELYRKEGMFHTKVLKDKEEEGAKFKDYFEWSEPVKSAPSHRVLAMRRGAAEKILSFKIDVPEEPAIAILNGMFLKAANDASLQVTLSVEDSFKRLLSLSIETEIRLETKEKADDEAIRVFAENLRELLLSPPMGQKTTLALDPGFRTGCKLVVLDAQGKLLFNDTVYPHTSQHKAVEDGEKIRKLCEHFGVKAVAIGNGTAGRETEKYIRSLGLSGDISVVMVNESGASIYSASEAAREEFPDHDLTVRGAVSIGRRLMDPLAELVKIDPKSIGVGQYQHDVDQKKLKAALDDVVISCVNSVGVELNTASKQLLTYVSGVGPSLAAKILEHRNKAGKFSEREELMNVSGLGAKAYEQCAGFLRIQDSINPLDASAVHPESYGIVHQMAKDLSCSVTDLMKDSKLRERIDLKKYVTDKVGMPTLTDIKAELSKPGRDPRKEFKAFSFKEGINEVTDLEVGMKLPGIVTNVTNFGAFVDIGVHQDGLVHISQISDSFVSNPAEVLKVHQQVEVTVTEIDIPRKRISLSMRKDADKTETKGKITLDAGKEKIPHRGDSKNRRPAGDRRGNNDRPKDSKRGGNGTFGESLGLQLKL